MISSSSSSSSNSSNSFSSERLRGRSNVLLTHKPLTIRIAVVVKAADEAAEIYGRTHMFALTPGQPGGSGAADGPELARGHSAGLDGDK